MREFVLVAAGFILGDAIGVNGFMEIGGKVLQSLFGWVV